MSAAEMPPDMVLAHRQQGIVQNLLLRIDAALALHPRVLTDSFLEPGPVLFCDACNQRWPCANVRALMGEGT